MDCCLVRSVTSPTACHTLSYLFVDYFGPPLKFSRSVSGDVMCHWPRQKLKWDLGRIFFSGKRRMMQILTLEFVNAHSLSTSYSHSPHTRRSRGWWCNQYITIHIICLSRGVIVVSILIVFTVGFDACCRWSHYSFPTPPFGPPVQV